MTHPLRRYLDENPGKTQQEICDRAAVSRMTLWRLLNGQKLKPEQQVEYSTGLLKRISEATDGHVTVAELVEALPMQQQGA